MNPHLQSSALATSRPPGALADRGMIHTSSGLIIPASRGGRSFDRTAETNRPPSLPFYLRIENAEGYVLIAVYLLIYLYACYLRNTKSIKPNRMKFGGVIVYYPGTI